MKDTYLVAFHCPTVQLFYHKSDVIAPYRHICFTSLCFTNDISEEVIPWAGTVFSIYVQIFFMKWILLLTLFIVSCGQNNTRAVVKDSATTSLITDTNTIITDTTITTQNTIDTNRLIIPGERMGKTNLGMDAALLDSVLGKPDRSDAAMGKAWLTWKGKRDEHNNATVLNIYTTYKDSTMRQKTVQQIRTTSSYFSTANNIHVYSSLADIEQQFPAIKKAAQYKDDGRTIDIYDERQQGIAFEIATANNQQICTGIIVHQKGKDVTDVYMYLHPGMQQY